MTPRRRLRPALALAASLAWLALLVGLQQTIDGRLVVVPWLALGPLAASLALRWRATGVVAASSVGAVALISGQVGDLPTTAGVVRLGGAAALAGFAVVSSVVRVAREERVRRVTEVAAVAQTAILHPVPASAGGFALGSRYVSATRDALVGGDLFDAVATSCGVRVVVGDVRGQGLAAVHTTAAVLSAFRHAAPVEEHGLDDVARAVEAAVAPGLAEEEFVTAVLCEVRPGGLLRLVRCGHPAPLRLAPGRAPEEVGEHSCPPLGLGVDPRVESAHLAPDERLLLFTDGLLEARSPSGAHFDLPLAAAGLASAEPATPAALDAALAGLFEAVRTHAGGTISDDVAALLLQAEPSSAPAVPAAVAPGPRRSGAAGHSSAVVAASSSPSK